MLQISLSGDVVVVRDLFFLPMSFDFFNFGKIFNFDWLQQTLTIVILWLAESTRKFRCFLFVPVFKQVHIKNQMVQNWARCDSTRNWTIRYLWYAEHNHVLIFHNFCLYYISNWFNRVTKLNCVFNKTLYYWFFCNDVKYMYREFIRFWIVCPTIKLVSLRSNWF